MSRSLLSMPTLTRVAPAAVALLCFGAPTFAAPESASAPTPFSGGQATSEIPARRDFPVNPEISPCENFEAYACSRVQASFKLRDDRSHHDFSFSDSQERLLEAKKKYLRDLSGKDAGLSQRSKTLRNVFVACMDEKSRKKEEVRFVENVQKKLSSLKTRDEFYNFLGETILTGEPGFFEFGGTANLDKPDWNDAVVLADLMDLPERSYYDRADVIKDYEDVLSFQLKALKVDRPEERAKQIVAFEKEFAQTFPLPAEFRELWNQRNGVKKSEVLDKYKNIRFATLFKEIPDATLIRHLTPKNLEALDQSLAKADLEVLKTVYLIRGTKGYMDDAYPEVFQKRFDFNHKHLGGPEKRSDREERCTQYVMRSFDREIDAELLPVLFPGFPREKFVSLAEKVRASIVDGIRSSKWLSKESKRSAEEKVLKARLQLVSPDREEDWNFNPPAEYFPNKHYENQRIRARNLIVKELAELKIVRNLNRWEMGPLTVNAYYSPSDNKFVMPIGILQYPFYDPTLSESENFGAVGAVIGHELGHGIDDEGAKYDAGGKLRQWMTGRDVAEFQKRGNKLVSQFDKAGHNGKLTLGENIGDLVGVTFAYRAAFKGGKPNVEKQRAFFTQYARVWCDVSRPKFQEMMLKTNPHSLPKARINEQVKQQPAFAEAFQCKKGDPMVLPQDQRVVIW